MDLSNRHNLRRPPPNATALRFGVRVTMPSSDPFRRLLGDNWQKEHWFASREDRDAAREDMGKRHAYSRIGDVPSILIESIER